MKDMTRGNPVKEVLLFSVPMILASVFQQAYNAVDSIIVGQFVGANALAAVGAAGPAMFLAMSILIGITMGVQIIISQLFGAGEYEKMRTTSTASATSRRRWRRWCRSDRQRRSPRPAAARRRKSLPQSPGRPRPAPSPWLLSKRPQLAPRPRRARTRRR